MKMKTILAFSALCLLFAFGCSQSEEKPKGQESKVYKNDMEGNDEWIGKSTLKEVPQAHSGKYVSKLDSANEFGIGFSQIATKIAGGIPKQATVKMWVKIIDTTAKATLVFQSIKPDGSNVNWDGISLKKIMKKPNEWFEVNFTQKFKTELKGDEKVMVYCWNENKKNWLVDDFEVSFK